MVSLIIIVMLLFGILMGLKRGFILQIFHFVGFIISFIVAVIYFRQLAEHLAMWIPYPELSDSNVWADFLQSMPVQNAFYHAIAFALIFFAVKIILQIIASMLDFVASFPILNPINKSLGAVFGFLEVYFILFIILFITALIPIDSIQQAIQNSSVAMFIIQHTPFLSGKITELWFGTINSIFQL